ncbi:MAG: lipopolysaccharide transport periplasmic protein LptA [Casimicrobiaceae bacterium]|nr:lipopolysaccharide transport periplasmic protein LptA [Casimicrobiaceae bacterium]MCX8097466.1 lipopolysaccharide transport periplasmic protein LptA [Casimicrobiaceae bacterium]MDW8311184.1 lipopolysaccharide transport periplasmic protein LptA [Burkholderiales bacterium]
MNVRFRLLVLWVCAGLLAAGPVGAERQDRRQKVVVTALDLDGEVGPGIVRVRRNVVITQGTLRITADQADVRRRGEEHYSATLTAKPVCFRERLDRGDWAQGVADRVEYDSAEGLVELIGNAILYVGEDEIRAQYILYSLSKGTFEARDSRDRAAAAPAGRGVTLVFTPRESETPPSADGKAVAKPAPVKQATPPKRHEPAFSRCS